MSTKRDDGPRAVDKWCGTAPPPGRGGSPRGGFDGPLDAETGPQVRWLRLAYRSGEAVYLTWPWAEDRTLPRTQRGWSNDLGWVARWYTTRVAEDTASYGDAGLALAPTRVLVGAWTATAAWTREQERTSEGARPERPSRPARNAWPLSVGPSSARKAP